MEIEKMLIDLPSCVFGNETLYNGLAFEKRIKGLTSYVETENVFLVPFYVWTEPNRRYEIYEYGLDILFEDEETLEEYAKRIFSVNSLAYLTEDKLNIFNRMRKCKIYMHEGENILPAVQKWIEYILYGEEIRHDYDEYFNGFSPENIYFAIY